MKAEHRQKRWGARPRCAQEGSGNHGLSLRRGGDSIEENAFAAVRGGEGKAKGQCSKLTAVRLFINTSLISEADPSLARESGKLTAFNSGRTLSSSQALLQGSETCREEVPSLHRHARVVEAYKCAMCCCRWTSNQQIGNQKAATLEQVYQSMRFYTINNLLEWAKSIHSYQVHCLSHSGVLQS